MKKTSLLILIILLGSIILGFSFPARAAILDRIDDPKDICVFAILISNIKNFALMIAGPITVLMIIIGGIMITVSGGQENLRAQGKKTVTGGIIGLIIVILAWVIVTSILVATLRIPITEGLWTVECPEDSYSPPTTPGNGDGDPTTPSGEFGGTLAGSRAGASSSMTSFLSCFEQYIPSGETWTITSVVDNTNPACTPQNNGNPLNCPQCVCGPSRRHCPIENCSSCTRFCSHSRNSCHYGGPNCTDGSYAIDFVGANKRDVDIAATKCNGAFVLQEGTHIHMSIGRYQGNTCGCN